MADDDDIPEDEAEFEDEGLEVELDPDELGEPDEDELVGDEDDPFVGDEDDLVADADEEDEAAPTPATRRLATADEDDDDEDIVDPDDVEADLDMILKDRLVAAEDEPLEEDEDEEAEVDDRGDPVDRIQPKRPGEFVCQSCFLVKHPNQLADAKKKLCTDCV
jgi:hypothetical protein